METPTTFSTSYLDIFPGFKTTCIANKGSLSDRIHRRFQKGTLAKIYDVVKVHHMN